ncbi:MAG: glucose-6-phosphate dehydrogenase [Chloroflexota bacterium]|jgi:glucose-6-phosphate 1-dehydrogenase
MNEKQNPTIIVIFGAGGDLTQRKLVPALYNLYLDNWLSGPFIILGLDRKQMDDNAFIKHLRLGIDMFSRREADDETWNAFSENVTYFTADLTNQEAYETLSEKLSAFDKHWGDHSQHIFYLAVSPFLIEPIAEHLHKTKLMQDRQCSRVVVEKPFGHDLESAQALNKTLTRFFDESQIYRIDHYLGKETVQNILAFRFANALFEPTWDRRYIDHVQITVAEQVGVGHRGGYYDHAGALRDMIQNHLLQILCLIAMEPPVAFSADEIRNKKVDVLRAIRLISPEQVPEMAVRGQYGSGWLRGERKAAYTSEEDVAADSSTETFAAVKLFVDNWRWQDVPFYMRTGKRLPVHGSQVAVTFLPVPHRSFPESAVESWHPNRLIINIQPEEGICIAFQAKRPGPVMNLSPVHLDFSYQEAFKTASPEAYETLLLDIIKGDATLFMRADQVEASWKVIMPVLEAWLANPPRSFPNYPAGTWGPEAANALIAQDGRSWLQLDMPH